VLAALCVLAIAGLATYFAVPRNRADPVDRRATVRPAAPAAEGSEPTQASYILRQQRVYYRTTQPAGTVIVARNQRFLYVVQPNQVAIRYAIAVGPECDGIGGLFRVTAKVMEPNSGPIEAGSASPRAGDKAKPGAAFDPPILYFGGAHAVHRASEPGRIGGAATHGCFQAWTQDIADLYERVPIDERVVVTN
jgi:lipoprotein-anchoring transpeptidase ErfK/SrfK